ncbi:MAG: bifunctional phosphoribosylaminoimidazolecarboxamide formyltransferase/IMP cyclohydrolase [Coriobacteriales bacterium]|jgi:phosphoribosylaminoimidazolecarboxamide formyltransferase/IMP cyclohydrolase|nr:bifunctional phosphoribosylaminoimidazolecarboxamide formyltransferase/IMP cyclohydrolase [Coriobacteriales bacterium]
METIVADPKVKRVLISVTDKSGVVDFARALAEEFGAEIVSTGGTAKALEQAGVAVRPIDDLTGFPEMMDGRVKTLHPRVHGGLLARRDLKTHMAAAAEHGIGMIDMVVVNLYAFEATVAHAGVTFGEAIENIDIGGPSMLRSAAKNHASVAVVTDPTSYDEILAELRAHEGATTLATRTKLALEVFRLTSAYDNAIYNWLRGQLDDSDSLAQGQGQAQTQAFAADSRLFLAKAQELRYGENPHQKAAFYHNPVKGSQGTVNPAYQLANATQLQGKELSYNNYLDLDAAWGAVREFDEPTCVIVKHLTPCGIASADDIVVAYQRAHDCDTVSAFGGVMAFNRPVTGAIVEAIYANGQFIEAIIAPSFAAEARELFTQKPNARILETGGLNPPGGLLDYRSVEGGMLAQTPDTVGEDPSAFTVPTKRQPTATELDELLFAWKACKSVKSNAILIARDKATVGAGAGQPNRVNSAQLAVKQAGEKARGAAAASDAFMPFADSLEVLIAAGVTAVIQPGGSIRDEEVIAAADAANVALVFTGHRHFRH